MNQLEVTKQALNYDLENHPSSLSNPISDPRTYRKICDYLFVAVQEGLPKSEITDWLYKLYAEQTDEQKHKFSSMIDLLAGALIAYNTYITQK